MELVVLEFDVQMQFLEELRGNQLSDIYQYILPFQPSRADVLRSCSAFHLLTRQIVLILQRPSGAEHRQFYNHRV